VAVSFKHTSVLNRTSCFEQIKFITENTKVNNTSITNIYKDNQNGKNLQQLLNCRAERLGCIDQVVLIKVEGSASAFRGSHLD
jgi:hypothetical protein